VKIKLLPQKRALTVPTVINGIATVTSIIIGFSGTTIGLIFKDLLEEITKEKEAVLAVLALPFVGSLAILYNAYIALSMGGIDFLERSWRYALNALIVALFSLLFSLLLFTFLSNHKKLGKKVTTKNSKLKEQEISEQTKLKHEFQNRKLL